MTGIRARARASVATPRLAAVMFCIAGVLFVYLSISDGYAAIAPHGIDVRLTDEAAGNILLVTGLTWLVGLISAVGGLVAWARRDLAPRRKKVIAVTEVVVMFLLIVIAGVVIGTASTMTA